MLVEVSKGHHAGTGATVDDLFQDWIVELRRKGRSPNTCRWGWRDSNPAQWAEPPAIPNATPLVPTPVPGQPLEEIPTKTPQGSPCGA